MPRTAQPLFLANARYRQRRLRDALSLMPVLGAVLFAVPILWPRGSGAEGAAAVEATSNATALVYIFAMWIGLIILGATLAWRLRPGDGDDPAERSDAKPDTPTNLTSKLRSSDNSGTGAP